jgi:signal-transduction protein with cAMP-binding, CBS, and nucleotidyltransferase domain
MTDSPRPVDADSPLWAATIVMLRHGIRHLPVTDEHGIVGMLSIRDALAVSDQDRIVGPGSGGLLDA